MTVVCGKYARSGTSLICQTLALLGMEMAAEKFIDEHENIKQFNEGGYYEINTNEGITDDRYAGKCVKLWGLQLSKTDKRLIKKLIYIERDRTEAIASYEKLRPHLPYSKYSTEEIFEANRFFVNLCIDKNTLKLKLEQVRKNPPKYVKEIINFTQLEPTEEQVLAAINNIR